MCLAVPGKIVSLDDTGSMRIAKVDFAGVITDVCVEWLPEASMGDYVLTHAGLAITRLSEEDAVESLKALADVGEIPYEYVERLLSESR